MCLDGSPPGYYFHPGTGSGANKWLLHLKGGGWCFEGIESCYNRSFTTLGTSNNWTSTIMLDGALSPDQASNPAFYNWNIVYFMYCDGASFSADRYICMLVIHQVQDCHPDYAQFLELSPFLFQTILLLFQNNHVLFQRTLYSNYK